MRLFFSNAFMGGMVLAGSFLFPLQAVGQDFPVWKAIALPALL